MLYFYEEKIGKRSQKDNSSTLLGARAIAPTFPHLEFKNISSFGLDFSCPLHDLVTLREVEIHRLKERSADGCEVLFGELKCLIIADDKRIRALAPTQCPEVFILFVKRGRARKQGERIRNARRTRDRLRRKLSPR